MERGVCVQTPVASVLTRPTSAVKPVNVTSKVRISSPRAKYVWNSAVEHEFSVPSSDPAADHILKVGVDM
jgi:hypothetical protein